MNTPNKPDCEPAIGLEGAARLMRLAPNTLEGFDLCDDELDSLCDAILAEFIVIDRTGAPTIRRTS